MTTDRRTKITSERWNASPAEIAFDETKARLADPCLSARLDAERHNRELAAERAIERLAERVGR